jgi:hypothetical protein
MEAMMFTPKKTGWTWEIGGIEAEDSETPPK